MSSKSPLDAVLKVLGSNGIAAILLILFLVLTFLGTIEQTEKGLFEVQAKYFESLFLVHWFFDVIPIPLPGVYLVLILLTINLIIGGIIRVQKAARKAGLLIAHGGIVLLFVSGFAIHTGAQHGYVRLFEGDSTDQFVSHTDWELAVTPLFPVDGVGEDEKPGLVEYVIPVDSSGALEAGKPATFDSDALPFRLTVTDYMENSRPRFLRSPDGMTLAPGSIDGFVLEEEEPDKEASTNARGAKLLVNEKISGKEHRTLLWGGDEVYVQLKAAPYVVEVEGKRYAIDLRKKRTPMPFSVELDKFTKELHPRTEQAKVFKSDVTKTENGVAEEMRIEMNEPLRRLGITMYQSSYGQDNRRGTYSVLAVVKNPADQWPLWSTIVIAVGLLVHFVIRLKSYIDAESRRRA